MLDFSGEEYEDGVKAYHETPAYYYSNKIGKPEKAFGKNHDQYRNWQINQPLFDGKASGNGCQKRKAVLLIIWQKKCSLDGVCRIKQIRGLAMDGKLRQFYTSSQHYLSRLEGHGQGSFATSIELYKAVIPPEASILECGCGLGVSAHLLAKEAFKVTAIDVSPLFISKAKTKYGDQHNLIFLEGDVGNLPFSDNSFDAVGSSLLMEHVLEHISFVHCISFMRESRRILKPGGG